MRKNVAVFASGEGRLTKSLIEYSQRADCNFEISLIVSNRSNAGVHEVANANSIPFRHISELVFGEKFESEVSLALQSFSIDWIVLAGYLKKFPNAILSQFPNRVVNIHPSLLPNFGGHGMFGNRVHEAVLKSGVAETGATIHFVSEEFDAGEIIASQKIKVDKSWSAVQLSARVRSMEHVFLPEILQKLTSRETRFLRV